MAYQPKAIVPLLIIIDDRYEKPQSFNTSRWHDINGSVSGVCWKNLFNALL
jgi:hypothetical protein